MTLGELIREVEGRFRKARLHYGHGTDNPRDEAFFLAIRALHLPFDSELHQAISRPQVSRVQSLATKRIKERIPVAYLLKEAWLGGHSFYVDGRVIIPRSHIAELLSERMKPWKHGPVRCVLDLCTGSGCLAILAALAFPQAQVDASDVSPAALAVAAVNVKRHRLKTRVRLIRSDLFESLDEARYDLIIANPPYVTTRTMRTVPAEYRHEPALALAGGGDGLLLVRTMLGEAPRHLTPRGLFVCEIGDNRRALERAYPDLPFVWPQTAAGSGQVFALERKGMG